MQTNLKITTKNLDTNKTSTNTIAYVNPNINDETAKNLAQRLAAFSSDSYQLTERIDTRELDNDTRPAYRINSVWLHEYNGAGKAIQNVNGTLTININAANLWTVTQSGVQKSQVRFNFSNQNIEAVPVFTVPENFAWTYLTESSSNAVVNVTTPALVTSATSFEFDLYFPDTTNLQATSFHFVVNVTD